MLNYYKSEMYRLGQTKSTYLMGLVFLFLPIFPTLLCWWSGVQDETFLYNNAKFMYMFASHSFVLLTFGVMIIASTVFNNEYAHGTFKNSIAYGMKRRDLYFGKLLAVISLTLIYMIVILIVFTTLIETLMKGTSIALLKEFLLNVSGSFPLFLSQIVVAVALAFIFRKESVVYISYLIVYLGITVVLELLDQLYHVPKFVFSLLPDKLIAELTWQTPQENMHNWLLFLGYLLITSLVTLKLFNQRDL